MKKIFLAFSLFLISLISFCQENPSNFPYGIKGYNISESIIYVNEASQIVNQVLDSNKVYFITQNITISDGETIIIPVGGLTLDGYGFNISSLFASADNHTMFSSPVGGSGDIIMLNFSVTTIGANSKVFDVTDSDGSHAIELEYVNFNGCTSLGSQDDYRQGTWTTVGVYGCDDGIQLSGSWNGYKISNTNCFGFDSGGTLIKNDTDTTFDNRLFLSVNIDFPTGAKLCDFDATNFNSNELFQINSSIAKVNGVIAEENAETLVPNISANNDKCLWVGNIGLFNSADERYVEDVSISGSYEINWLKDTYNLTMTGDTAFSESNLPASGKNSAEIKIYLTGNFVPTWPSGWEDNMVGTYKGSDINEITVKFLKTGLYFVKINNSLSVYPAPSLEYITPVSLLPSATQELEIYGSFFTPNTIVSIEGQTVNSVEFVNSSKLILSVTTGATEDEFDITISNGTSVTFLNALIVNLGDVFVPTESDWTGVSANADVSETGNFKVTISDVDQNATWTPPIDNTKDWTVRFKFKNSPLSTSENMYFDFVDDVTSSKKISIRWINTLYLYLNGSSSFSLNQTININQIVEVTKIGSTITIYWNGVPKYTATPAVTFSNNWRINIHGQDAYIEGIKYIELP